MHYNGKMIYINMNSIYYTSILLLETICYNAVNSNGMI